MTDTTELKPDWSNWAMSKALATDITDWWEIHGIFHLQEPSFVTWAKGVK